MSDLWLDESLAQRAVKALQAIAPGMDVSAGDVAAAQTTIETAVTNGLARQSADMAAVGAPLLVPAGASNPQRTGYLTYVEQFERPHTIVTAAQAAGTSDPLAESAAWWLAHRWWRSLTSASMATPDEPASHADALAAASLLLAAPLDDLPDMLGDHLGGSDPVLVGDLRNAVDGLTWTLDGDRLLVSGTAPHPAIEVALRDCFDSLTPALIKLSRLAPGLPLTIETRIEATRDKDGQPAYIAAGARFELAQDRVRTLLMGEQLYGDKSLAIRELYQNAVDATRHTGARLEYLTQQGAGGPSTYEPEVLITQDVTEDGREYIECTDNGVGMGLNEIRWAFAQLGMRSADLPEFVAELADFAAATPPVDLWTNSRFGIGALSYFMIADRVDITTARLERDGSLGHTLKVAIPGPGLCFRITDAGASQKAGTTVRLWLRQPGSVSVIGALNKSLVVAPVLVVATMPQTGGQVVWQPDTLDGACVPDLTNRVWWTEREGSVLSDGLKPDRSVRVWCAYVDLRGDHAPQLSVDRNAIVTYQAGYLKQRLLSSVDTLLSHLGENGMAERICQHLLLHWGRDIDVNDAVANGLAHHSGTVDGVLMDCRVDLTRSGFVDLLHADATAQATNWATSVVIQSALPGMTGTSENAELEPASWGQLLRPQPSDKDLLIGTSLFQFLNVDKASGHWPLAILGLKAATLERPVTAVRERYDEIGIHFPHWRDDLPWDATTVAVLRECDLSSEAYPRFGPPVPEMMAWQTAHSLGISVQQVERVLDAWEVPHEDFINWRDRPPTVMEQLFFAKQPDNFIRGNSTGWCRRGARKDIDTLLPIAEYLGRGLREVAQMAHAFGFDSPTPVIDTVLEQDKWVARAKTRFSLLQTASNTKRPVAEIVRLANDLGANFDPVPQLAVVPAMGWFTPPNGDGPLSRVAVLVASKTSQASLQDIAAALEWADFQLVGPTLDQISNVDVALATDATDDEERSVWRIDKPLNPYFVMAQAVRCQIDAPQALLRFQHLGYEVSHPELIRDMPIWHLLLASVRGGSLDLWTQFYEPGQMVSAARVWQAKRETGKTYDELLADYAGLGLDAEDPRVVFPVRRPGPVEPSETT